MTKYAINTELNGIEIIFEEKPNAETLEALKTAGYRWHKVKKLWYAKQTPARVELAKRIAEGNTAPEATPKASAKINLDNLGENKPMLYGSELAQAIRADLKRRGVDGVSIRQNRGGYTTSITLTVKATAADLASIEEAKLRYPRGRFSCDLDRSLYINGHYISYADFDAMKDEEKENIYTDYVTESIKKINSMNPYYIERPRYWELTTTFFNKVKAAFLIANQWNYNNSDIMTDYHDVGYYLDIDIKKPDDFEPREEMTEEEREAFKEEREAEERERAEAIRKYEEERKQAEEAAKRAEEAARKRDEIILNGYTLETLEKPIYFSNLATGIGKEATEEELDNSINEYHKKRDCIANYKITFTPEALEAYTHSFLHDFEFLAGKGGSTTSDTRITDEKQLSQLTQEQRETIKFYNVDCIAVYCEGQLRFVVDPQGYAYSRYVYKPTEETTETDAETETARQAEESKAKKPFYIPAPVADQIENIKPGADITIYQCDGWILNNIEAGAGTVKEVKPGNYAQYNGYYIKLENGKKEKTVFIRENNETVIFSGILPRLPETVTSDRITQNAVMMRNYNELFPAMLDYYEKQGKRPIFDTVAR